MRPITDTLPLPFTPLATLEQVLEDVLKRNPEDCVNAPLSQSPRAVLTPPRAGPPWADFPRAIQAAPR